METKAVGLRQLALRKGDATRKLFLGKTGEKLKSEKSRVKWVWRLELVAEKTLGF
jgi:hypothetical protein